MKYYDANGDEYQEGDIVFNPCIGDYWVVQKVTEQDKKDYDLEADLCLALYNDKDHYCTDIDVPAGFVIVMRKDAQEYSGVIEEMKSLVARIYEKMESDSDGSKK